MNHNMPRIALIALLSAFTAGFHSHAQQSDPPKDVRNAETSTSEIRGIEAHHYGQYAYLPKISQLISRPDNQSKQTIVATFSEAAEHHRVGGASTDPVLSARMFDRAPAPLRA